MRTLLAILILLLPLSARAAEPLGRLFFTPEQRAQLDTLRTKKVVAVQVKDEPAPEFVSYGGIVRGSEGKTTVWVNSKALSEREVREASSLVGRIERDGRILVETTQGTSTPGLRLKVGQRVELLSGRIEERFETVRQEQSTKPSKKADTTTSAPKTELPPVSPAGTISREEAAKIAPIDAETAAKLKAIAETVR
jgi:hypothetical protein